MKSALLFLVFSCLGFADKGAAQSTRRLDSSGADIVLTVWGDNQAPPATVLLLPGWGGGPSDVLGVARALSAHGLEVVVLTPRGWHTSEGTYTFAHALDDIGVTLTWLRRQRAHPIVLGGYSWGGGMALAYAAQDPTVARVFSIGGTDHGQFIRQYQEDAGFARLVDRILGATSAPAGPIAFDLEAILGELAAGQAVYGLVENAAHLADRSVLLVGGWEDENVTIDQTLLPFYRALRTAGADDIVFRTYHADHTFASDRASLHRDLLEWITP